MGDAPKPGESFVSTMPGEQPTDKRAEELAAIRARVQRCEHAGMPSADGQSRRRALDRAWLLEQLDAAEARAASLATDLEIARHELAEEREACQEALARAERNEADAKAWRLYALQR